MKFSLSWLKEYLDTKATAEELASAMVDLGIEVEGIESESQAFNHVVVGRIITRTQHPDAEKLGVCSVDVGEKEPVVIVCGAPNARDDLMVAVATIGAVLPGDFSIKKSKLRGVTSNGMICSIKELGLGDEAQGIMELSEYAGYDAKKHPAGTYLAEVLGSDDVTFDVSITPNRGDVLSVYGIARDLAAAKMGHLIEPKAVTVKGSKSEIKISLNSKNCSYFASVEIKNVKNVASPEWLQKRLLSAGLNPISALVDVTNYINLTLCQPMHAYDVSKLQIKAGGISASDAKGGEKFLALDENEYELQAGDLVICDDSGVIGLAGIMGGMSTCVDGNTSHILLEAANFDRSRIALTGQAHHLLSEARYRFERGIDPAMTPLAMQIAVQLITEICGGETSAMAEEGSNQKKVPTIDFPANRIKTLGGLDLPKAEVISSLERLGFAVKEKDNGKMLAVTPPSYRTYMETPEDLVEEILRLQGYDKVPLVLPNLTGNSLKGADKGRKADRMARRELAAAGYLEAINYSFINNEDAELFNPTQANLLTLSDPIDAENMGTMRPSLLAGLLRAASANMARGESYLKLGEVGKVYTEESEVLKCAGIIIGKPTKDWRAGEGQVADVFDAKADVLRLLKILGAPVDKLQARVAKNQTSMHPGKSGELALGKNVFATFGEIHPKLLKHFKLKNIKTVAMFEINLDALANFKAKGKALIVSDYQAVSRDFAFVVKSDVMAGDLLNAINGSDKNLIKQADLFDVYEGDKLGEGEKSLAVRVTMQSMAKTLNDDEINAVCDKIVANATKRCGAVVR